MTHGAESLTWWQEDPRRLEREVASMSQVAPELAWSAEAGAWAGRLPVWPFERPEPAGLEELVIEPLQVLVVPSAAHPMIAPAFVPQDVDVPAGAIGFTEWHVAPDQSLCLLQSAAAWRPEGTIADLVPKASGWYIEYLLLRRGSVKAMTINGIVTDPSIDDVIRDKERRGEG